MTGRIVAVPGPGLDGRDCQRWGSEAGVEVAVHTGDPAAAVRRVAEAAGQGRPGAPHPDTLGVVLAAGPDGLDDAALAEAVASVRVPVVAVEPGNVRRNGLRPEDSRLAAAGARVLYGRGPDTGRHAVLFLARRREQVPDTLAYGPEPGQEGDLWVPGGPGPHPVAVLFHGGFWYHAWERDLMDGLAVELARRGIAAWNAEYRRVGSGGGWPATGEDAARATDHLVALAPVYGLDVERVVLLGHSAGAQLALWVAARGRRAEVHPGLVVGLAALADLEAALANRVGGGSVARLLDGGGESVGDPGDREVALCDASPLARVPIGVPQVLIHAVDDNVVPVSQTSRYAAAASSAGDDVAVVELASGGHFDLIDPRTAAGSTVVSAVETRLRP